MLYEMVTGKLPFQGEYRQVLAYAITNEEPQAVTVLRPDAPVGLQALIERALAKDPEQRYQHADELIGEIKLLRSHLQQTPPAVSAVKEPLAAAPPRQSPRGKKSYAVLAGVVGVAALIGVIWFVLERPEPLAPPPQITPLTSYAGREEFPSFSPDGNKVAFSWNGDHEDNFDIYVKVVDSAAPLRLTSDPASDLSPAWSPDGRQIAFLRDSAVGQSHLYLVPPLGGTERRLASVAAPASWGLAWSRDSRFLAVPDRQAPDGPVGISLIDAASGQKQWIAAAPTGADRVLFPGFSPDGKTLAFDIEMGTWLGDTYLVDTAGGEPRRITFDGGQSEGLAWTPDGRHILAARMSRLGRRTCWRIPVPEGKPELVNLGDNPTQPAFSSRPGRWAFSKRISRYDIRRTDTSDPQAEPILFASSTQLDANPQFSPDGRRVAFSSNRSGGIEIYVAHDDGSRPTPLTSLENTGSPRWSPDGARIAFDAIADGNADVYVVDVAGGPPRRMTASPHEDVLPGWSADGQWLYFTSNRSGQPDIWKMRADQPGKDADALRITHQGGFYAVESPDARWLYYSKERALETAIWKVPVDGGEETPLIGQALAGWGNLVATPRGLYFAHRKQGAAQDPRWAVMLLPPGEATPRELAEIPRFPTLGGPGLSVSPDGRWILTGQIDIASDLMLVETQP